MCIACESVRVPRIFDVAPDFEANSTEGPIRLSNYTSQGKWVLLFSHPADFTPVCSSEFIELARRAPEFEKLRVQIIGVSVDSIYSHIAWMRDMEHRAGVAMTFPVVADLDHKVSQAYGLIHESTGDTSTVRAVFVIDPGQRVRALMYYPKQLGRNIGELLRMIQGLQAADANAVSVPANWTPGEPVMLSAPLTFESARERAGNDFDGAPADAWYMLKKEIPADPTDAMYQLAR
jgi:peroxiredoxin (alkyl hydroperoxide reductase subunit C)